MTRPNAAMEAIKTKEEPAVEIHLKNADLTQREIGERLGWDQGRVSRALSDYYRRHTRERMERVDR